MGTIIIGVCLNTQQFNWGETRFVSMRFTLTGLFALGRHTGLSGFIVRRYPNGVVDVSMFRMRFHTQTTEIELTGLVRLNACQIESMSMFCLSLNVPSILDHLTHATRTKKNTRKQ